MQRRKSLGCWEEAMAVGCPRGPELDRRLKTGMVLCSVAGMLVWGHGHHGHVEGSIQPLPRLQELKGWIPSELGIAAESA